MGWGEGAHYAVFTSGPKRVWSKHVSECFPLTCYLEISFFTFVVNFKTIMFHMPGSITDSVLQSRYKLAKDLCSFISLIKLFRNQG